MRQRRESHRQPPPTSPEQASKSIRFDSRLVRGLDEDALAEFAARWQSSRIVRESITRVLTDSLNRAILQSESGEAFASPHPALFLADQLSYRRGLREAIQLLTNQDQV